MVTQGRKLIPQMVTTDSRMEPSGLKEPEVDNSKTIKGISMREVPEVSELSRLYVNENPDCQVAKAFLEKSGVAFKEINIENLNLQGYIWKDLGTTQLPVLAMPEKMFSGLREITEYAKGNGKE